MFGLKNITRPLPRPWASPRRCRALVVPEVPAEGWVPASHSSPLGLSKLLVAQLGTYLRLQS